MPPSSTRYVWQQPVGIPNNCSIQIGVGGLSSLSGSTATVYPAHRSASHIQLYEGGAYNGGDGTWWEAIARSHEYTFSGDGSKTLCAAFRNPGFYVVGDDQSISATVTIDTGLDHGLPEQIKTDIVTILRGDSTLQARHTDWASTSTPHVIPDWRHEDPSLSAAGNKGRVPFVEIKTGLASVTNTGNGYFDYTIQYLMRAYVNAGIDTDTGEPDQEVNDFLWEIAGALDEYPRLLNNPAVKGHAPASIDPTTARFDPYRVGSLSLAVRAGGVRQNFNS